MEQGDFQKISHYNTTRIMVKKIELGMLTTLVNELTVMHIPFRASTSIDYNPNREPQKQLTNMVQMSGLEDEEAMRVTEMLKMYKLEYLLSIHTVHGAGE